MRRGRCRRRTAADRLGLALGFVIAYEELVRTGQLIYTGYRKVLPTALVIGIIYVAMNVALARLAMWTQRRPAAASPRPAVPRARRIWSRRGAMWT